MSGEQHGREIATHIWRLWETGGAIDALPDTIRPNLIEQGYAAQAELPMLARANVIGWKIAATSTAGQTHLKVDGPIAGRLLDSRVQRSGSDVSLGHNRMRVAEAEFAFTLGSDLPPRSTPYEPADVLDAIATLHPAIELPDSRFGSFEQVGAAQLAADNACTHWFILGEATSAAWRDLALDRHPVKLFRNQRLATEGTGADVLGSPISALTWLANSHPERGVGLKSGEVITTGVCGQPTTIEAGDDFVADFGELGQASVRIT
ncbi:MAG: fumarylacetoacetate hydrolase family protein [Pseudomonadota bacterium]